MDKSAFFKLPAEGLNGLATTRDFQFYVDEPLDIGGTDLAPTPMEYVYGALASCIAITLRLYATRKEWNTGEILVNVYKITQENGDEEIHKKIEFGNKELTEQQLKRLYKIAEACPVSKVFKQEIEVILDQP